MVTERIARGEKPAGVVGTLMTNKAVEVALQRQGIEFVRAKVGDRYVLEELDKRGWLLGGEGSGHLLALDRHTTGDGLVSALQVLQACVRSGKTVAQLLADVTLFPQTLINVRLAEGQDWKANTALADETRRVEAELGDGGRVLIRASGTEPVLRVMVEARDAAQAEAFAQRLAAARRRQRMSAMVDVGAWRTTATRACAAWSTCWTPMRAIPPAAARRWHADVRARICPRHSRRGRRLSACWRSTASEPVG